MKPIKIAAGLGAAGVRRARQPPTRDTYPEPFWRPMPYAALAFCAGGSADIVAPHGNAEGSAQMSGYELRGGKPAWVRAATWRSTRRRRLPPRMA